MANNNRKAIIAASLAVLSWSTVAAAFKTALSYFTHFEMLVVAAPTAALIFAVAITISGKWSSVAALKASDMAKLALLGALSPTLYYLVLFAAYSLLPAQVAQPINYFWPIFLVVLLAFVAHKPVRPKLYIGMVISFAGLTVISLAGNSLGGLSLSPTGLLLALLSALLWAFYWIANEKIKTGIDESVKLFVSFSFASLYLLAAIPFTNCDFNSLPGGLSSMYVGAFEMGIPFLFFSLALRNATNVALINQMCYIAPFLSLFFISVVVGESIMPVTYLGLSLIVAGVVYNQFFAYRQLPEPGNA